MSHLTFCDIIVHVADYQCAFLETYAIMDYDQLIVPRMCNTSNASEINQFVPQPPSHWLGGFTSSPLHAEGLCAAGVPMWLIRDKGNIRPQVIIEDIVTMWEPSDIVIHHYMDPVGQFTWPFDVELEGYSGHKDMHAKFCEVTYRHKSLAPTTSQNSRRAHHTHRGGKAQEGWQPCKWFCIKFGSNE